MYASTYDVDDAFISQDEMKELKKRELVRIERNIQGQYCCKIRQIKLYKDITDAHAPYITK